MYDSTMKNGALRIIGGAVLTAIVFMLALVAGFQLSGPGPSRSNANTKELREYGLDMLEDETTTKKDGVDTGKDDGSSGQVEDEFSDWQRVKNEALGLTFTIPPGYHVQNPGNYGDASLEITSYDLAQAPGSDVVGDAIKIEVYTEKKIHGVELNKWLSGRPAGEVEDLKRETRRVGSRSVVFETGYSMSNYLTYYIDRGGDVLILTAYAESRMLDEAKQVLDSIIKGLKFSEG